MVKRSRVDYRSSRSSGDNRRGAFVVTVGRAQLVLWCVALLCGAGGAGGAVASGSSIGDRSQAYVAAAAERTAVAAAGRYADDATAAARNGRSAANLSHITGTARKIKMFVKNRYLQVFPDGAVNSTAEDTSDYVILQRTSVNMGQLKIQGVATCMYLCMDACGLLYGSKEFDDECVFNEMIEQHHYNTYSSAKYTNDKRTLYLALNKRGLPRKVQVKANAPLGKLSTYTQVLTQPVSADRVEQLLATRHPVSGEWPASVPHGHRHHHACPPHVPAPSTASKHRKTGRKCQAKGGGGGSRKKSKEYQELARDAGSGGSKEEEDCAGGGNKKSGRCGGDETSHRKADAAGRKKKSKKPTAVGGGGGGGGGKGNKPHRQPGKSKKHESVDAVLPSELAIAVQTAVTTTAVAPSQFVDENDGGGGGEDDDDDDPTAVATAPTTTDD